MGCTKRVRVTMHEFPIRLCRTPKYPRHAQRPVLLWKISDCSVLSLDHDEYRQITRRVGLHDLDRCLAATKELSHAIQRRV